MAKKLIIGSTRIFDEDTIGQLAQGLGSGDNVEL